MSESSDEKTSVWIEDDQLPEDLQPGEEPGADGDSDDESDETPGDLLGSALNEGMVDEDVNAPEDPLPEG